MTWLAGADQVETPRQFFRRHLLRHTATATDLTWYLEQSIPRFSGSGEVRLAVEELVDSFRLKTDPERTSDEYGALLLSLLARRGLGAGGFDGVIVASVVPPLHGALERLARDYFGRKPLFVEPGVRTGMPIRYDNPAEVGADRIVNALAARELYGSPVVVVDFGTATTFDCVAADGAYVGGAIAPGLELGLEALAARTAKLPRIELRAPDRAIGRDTDSAMQAGTVFGYQALVAGLLTRIRRELADQSGTTPSDVRAILTGGL